MQQEDGKECEAPRTRGRSTRPRSLSRGTNDKRVAQRWWASLSSWNDPKRGGGKSTNTRESGLHTWRRWCDEQGKKMKESTLTSPSSDPTNVPVPDGVLGWRGVLRVASKRERHQKIHRYGTSGSRRISPFISVFPKKYFLCFLWIENGSTPRSQMRVSSRSRCL